MTLDISSESKESLQCSDLLRTNAQGKSRNHAVAAGCCICIGSTTAFDANVSCRSPLVVCHIAQHTHVS